MVHNSQMFKTRPLGGSRPGAVSESDRLTSRRDAALRLVRFNSLSHLVYCVYGGSAPGCTHLYPYIYIYIFSSVLAPGAHSPYTNIVSPLRGMGNYSPWAGTRVAASVAYELHAASCALPKKFLRDGIKSYTVFCRSALGCTRFML